MYLAPDDSIFLLLLRLRSSEKYIQNFLPVKDQLLSQRIINYSKQ